MDAFSRPEDLRQWGVCPRCRSMSHGRVVVGCAAWLICDRHMLRWLYDGDPGLLGNPRTGGERYYQRVTPLFFADAHPAAIKLAQLRDATRPRIVASSAARRQREAKHEATRK